MLGEPGAPGRRHAVAGLVEAARPPAGAAAHQADMAAVAAGQQGDDGGTFAVPACRQHDALVGPLDHAQGYSTAAGVRRNRAKDPMPSGEWARWWPSQGASAARPLQMKIG